MLFRSQTPNPKPQTPHLNVIFQSYMDIQLGSSLGQQALTPNAELSLSSTLSHMTVYEKIKTKLNTFKNGGASRVKMQDYIEKRNSEQSNVYPFAMEKDPLVLKVLCQLLYDEIELANRKNSILSQTSRTQRFSKCSNIDQGIDIVSKLTSMQAGKDQDSIKITKTVRDLKTELRDLKTELVKAKKTASDGQTMIFELKVENMSLRIKNNKTLNTFKDFSVFLDKLNAFLEDIRSSQSESNNLIKKSTKSKSSKIELIKEAAVEISDRMTRELKSLEMCVSKKNRNPECLPSESRISVMESYGGIKINNSPSQKKREGTSVKSTSNKNTANVSLSQQNIRPAAQLIRQPSATSAMTKLLLQPKPQKSFTSSVLLTTTSSSPPLKHPAPATSPVNQPHTHTATHASLRHACKAAMQTHGHAVDGSMADADDCLMAARLIRWLSDGLERGCDARAAVEAKCGRVEGELRIARDGVRELCVRAVDQVGFVGKLIGGPERLVKVFVSKNAELISAEREKVKLYAEKVVFLLFLGTGH